MKRIVCILLCCILLVSLAGCGASGDSYTPTGDGLTLDGDNIGGTATADPDGEVQSLTLTYYAERTMNPFKSSDFTNRALFSLIYQSLFVSGRDYRAEPMLCKQYSVSQDMKTYTFYIEENATFSDGSVLTVQDVLASLQKAKSSDYYGGRFHNVQNMSITEDGGVRIQTSVPYEDLPILLDIPVIKQTQLDEDHPMGTGPYVLETTEMSACLRRRTNWWCNPQMTITAPTISLVPATSATQIRDEFEFGDLSLVCADPGSDRYVDYRCDYELWDCENGIFLYLVCNQDSSVFKNAEVRAALTHAIDRDALVKDYYRGFARGASLPASPLSPYYNVALAEKYGYDSVAFSEAVNNAGFSGSKVTLLVNEDDSLRLRVARAIAQMLTDCGLTATVQAESGNDYKKALQSRNFDLYLGQTKLSPNMDLTAFFSTYGALNYGGINDLATYTLCQQALENHGNYYTLHKSIMDSGLLCPVLFRSYAVYATRGLLTGLTPSRDNVFFYSLGKTMENAKIAS